MNMNIDNSMVGPYARPSRSRQCRRPLPWVICKAFPKAKVRGEDGIPEDNRAFDTISGEVDRCSRGCRAGKLEEKIVLSIATRLIAVRFFVDRLLGWCRPASAPSAPRLGRLVAWERASAPPRPPTPPRLRLIMLPGSRVQPSAPFRAPPAPLCRSAAPCTASRSPFYSPRARARMPCRRLRGLGAPYGGQRRRRHAGREGGGGAVRGASEAAPGPAGKGSNGNGMPSAKAYRAISPPKIPAGGSCCAA